LKFENPSYEEQLRQFVRKYPRVDGLDALNSFYSGKFSERIITVNIFLEVFVHEFLYEKFLSEGKSSSEASELLDK
jgi:hypothetical protein